MTLIHILGGIIIYLGIWILFSIINYARDYHNKYKIKEHFLFTFIGMCIGVFISACIYFGIKLIVS